VGSEKGRTVYAKIIWKKKNHAKILLVFHAKLFMQAKKNWITKNLDTGCIKFKKNIQIKNMNHRNTFSQNYFKQKFHQKMSSVLYSIPANTVHGFAY